MARPSVKQQIIDAGLAELHARGYAACSAIVTELVAQAQRAGEISHSGDPATVGRFIVNAWEGALTRSRVVRSGQPIDDFFELISVPCSGNRPGQAGRGRSVLDRRGVRRAARSLTSSI